ncbi:hypothetical protein ACFPRL_23765 [Pseudoclavibacter helvolus]
MSTKATPIPQPWKRSSTTPCYQERPGIEEPLGRRWEHPPQIRARLPRLEAVYPERFSLGDDRAGPGQLERTLTAGRSEAGVAGSNGSSCRAASKRVA